jgi:hypothetical protein
MALAINYQKPVIYDEDFLEPAIAKPVNTATTTSTTTAPVNAGVSAIVEPNIVNPITKTCEEQASAKMATMRFSSAQGASDYRNNFINQCKGLPTATSSVVETITQPTTQTPTPTQAPTNVGVSNIVQPDFSNVKVYDLDTPTQAPTNVGGNNVVQPDFSNVKVYDLDTPSGGSNANTTDNTSASNDVPNENTGSSDNVSNGETKSNATMGAKKPNYVLYGGIAISAIILYKLLK